MVRIRGDAFAMGCDVAYPEEAPVHRVAVEDFLIDVHPVTNRDFSVFTAESGYLTLAERGADPSDYPAEFGEVLEPGSFVFHRPDRPVRTSDHAAWWRFVRDASWRQPMGPGSTLDGLDDHPVVHIALEDAEAYATWVGKLLPSEAQWEYAARGGLDGAMFCWGDDHESASGPMANVWQGTFPHENLMTDGYERTSPVATYPSNGYGLYDMAGNVWEWTRDTYADHHDEPVAKPCCATPAAKGTKTHSSVDPLNPEIPIPRHVLKGGSHLCAPNYCLRYRPAARLPQPIDTTTSHVGFRCVAAPTAGEVTSRG